MYPNQIHLHYTVPYSQDTNPSATPFKTDYYSTLDPRQFGSFQQPPAPPASHHGPPAPPAPPPGHHALPPGHHDLEAGPPTSPPPAAVPQQMHHAGAYAVDPGSMISYLHRYTYIWLRGFEQFWFYPTFIGRNSVSGYRWTGHRWVNYGVSLRQIQSFTCV
jgi:hypothetical protein